MTKTISFKVDDHVYKALRKKKVSFRVLFEQYAVELALNSKIGTKYTGGIRIISPSLYIDLSSLQKNIEKILNSKTGERF